VANNTVLATATHGILVVSQDRADAPAARRVTDVSVHDNVVVMNKALGTVGRTGLGWLEDWKSTLYSPQAHNNGTSNAFWFSYGEGSWQRFAWGGVDGGQSFISDFAATPGGRNSRYLSIAERDQALVQAGIPSNL
jgi:hypothetical protein